MKTKKKRDILWEKYTEEWSLKYYLPKNIFEYKNALKSLPYEGEFRS